MPGAGATVTPLPDSRSWLSLPVSFTPLVVFPCLGLLFAFLPLPLPGSLVLVPCLPLLARRAFVAVGSFPLFVLRDKSRLLAQTWVRRQGRRPPPPTGRLFPTILDRGRFPLSSSSPCTCTQHSSTIPLLLHLSSSATFAAILSFT